jgi:hypothetical protein
LVASIDTKHTTDVFNFVHYDPDEYDEHGPREHRSDVHEKYDMPELDPTVHRRVPQHLVYLAWIQVHLYPTMSLFFRQHNRRRDDDCYQGRGGQANHQVWSPAIASLGRIIKIGNEQHQAKQSTDQYDPPDTLRLYSCTSRPVFVSRRPF